MSLVPNTPAAASPNPRFAAAHSASVALPGAAGGEFLIFRLGAEEYCIDILKVQEIRGYDTVTAIANTPEFIKGVINLRGNIVPIVDLRLKFKLAHADYSDLTIVIILNIAKRMIGIVVDAVSDVIALADEQIKPAPRFGASMDTEFILGLGTLEDRMLIVVDIERLMSNREMELLDSVDQQ